MLIFTKYYILLIWITLTFFISVAYSQSDEIAGIKFNSQKIELSKNTSLLLNEGYKIELTNSFSISFDISFWDYVRFGPILRIADEYGNEIRIIYNQFKNKDTSFIQIMEPYHKNLIEVKLAKKYLTRNTWFNFKLYVDRKNRSLLAYWNYELVGKADYLINDQYRFFFAFGLKKMDDPNDFDVPPISIRNIIISEQDIIKHQWELNPFKENPLTDKISNSKIKATNISWVYQDHQKWKRVGNYKISDRPIPGYGVAFDSLNSRFFIDRKNDLLIFYLNSGKDSVIKYRTQSPSGWNDLLYEDSKQLLYSFMNALGNVSVYDLKLNTWTTVDTLILNDGKYFGSAKFICPKDKGLYLLGGYGYYKAKNDLFKYNFVKKEWEKIELKKNDMTPRAWFTFGKGFNEGEYIIYGGVGNESGNQEQGFKTYNDFYLLNMNDLTIKKINYYSLNKTNYSSLANYHQLDQNDSTIFFLSKVIEEKKPNIYLNKLNLSRGTISKVGDNFWKANSDKWYYNYLYYNKTTKEFFALVFDSTNVELFSINYPPISGTAQVYTENTNSEKNNSLHILIPIFVLISSGAVFVYLKKRNSKVGLAKSDKKDQNYNFDRRHIKNSVNLFGGLRIYDKDENEISQTLSPKLKEIFLLILLRSINNHHSGITSEELSSIIWPEASLESVKSNRGVAINKIRKILSSVDGVDMEFLDKVWFVKMNNGSSCDYADYLKFCNSAKTKNDSGNGSLALLLRIVNGGEFLKGISYEWLDPIKFAVNNEVIKCIKNYFEIEELKTDPEKTLRLCDMVLSFDAVDQDAIKLKIKTLLNQGKLHIAKSTYSLFVAEYKRLYDEQYPLTFQEIISS